MLKAIGNRRAAQQRSVPLKPTWSAETVIKAAKLLNILLFAKKPDLADIQSVLISIIGFVFALRAGSLASLRLKDLQLAGNNIVLALHTYKTKGIRQVAEFTVPWKSCEPLQPVRDFILKAKHFRLHDNSYLLPQSGSSPRPSTQVTQAMRRVCQLLRLPVPEGNQSHALRRGAASAMVAAGVPAERILSWGMWSTHESMKPYVKQSVWETDSEILQRCFGWMSGKLTSKVGIRRTDR